MDVYQLAADLFDGTTSQPARTYRHWMLARVGHALGADGALWRRAHLGEQTHGLTVWGLDAGFSRSWDRTAAINPLQGHMDAAPGQPAALSGLMADQPLSDARLRDRVLQPAGVEDVLAVAHVDSVLQLRTEVLFTRSDGAASFEPADCDALALVMPFMVAATTQAYFINLMRPAAVHASRPAAVIDASDRVVEAQTAFRDLLRTHFPTWRGDDLPFELPTDLDGETLDVGPLAVYAEHMADLTLLRVWERDALEVLSDREREVADRLAAGHTYKSIARDLSISPSTVANHVHRLYNKLGVSRRRELVAMMRE